MIYRQNWWQLSSILIGGVICLPVIMIGHTLEQTYGFMAALISILIGNAILLILGLITAKMSYEKGKTTIENAADYFGEKGISFFAIIMLFSMLAWFGIQLDMMSIGVLDLLSINAQQHRLAAIGLNWGIGLIMILFALRGIKALTLIADISLPLFIITIGYALFSKEGGSTTNQIPFSFAGISAVVAMSIVLVVDFPTFFRHAKSCKDGYIAVILLFGIAIPILELVGLYIAYGTSGDTILDVLKGQNGLLWNCWVALFIILAGWTTNNMNLYSAVICFETLIKQSYQKKHILLIGGLGTLLASFDLLNNLELVLNFMGILITSVGVVILTRYLIVMIRGPNLAGEDQRGNLIACGLGIAFGISSMLGISLTTVSVLDATIGACVGTLLMMLRKKSHAKAYAG